MQGTYKFFQEGRLLAAHTNLITTDGERTILRYLAGQTGTLGEALALGTSPTAPTVADDRLTYEADRVRVILKNVDFINKVLIFKSTLELNKSFKIYEIGLFNTYADIVAGDNTDKAITNFDSSFTNATLTATESRTSNLAARVDVGASATVSIRQDSDLNLSGYSSDDTFSLAFYKPNANIASIKLVFESISPVGAFTSPAITVSALPVGYNVIKFRKGNFVLTGSVNWSSITRYGVDVTASATAGYVTLDGLRIEDKDTINPDYTLISHSAFATPLVKSPTAPMDIEYGVNVAIG